MSSKILIKRSTTSGSVPTTSDLDTGELGLNTADKRVYTNNAGTIVELGTYPSSLNVTGNTDLDGTLNVDGAATLASGTVSGNWTVTGTLSVGTPTNSTDAASKGYVDTAVANVIDSAPDALNTLNELAAALNDDASFATTVTTALATKLPLAGGTMTGDIVLGSNKITTTADPATDNSLTRKSYVDGILGSSTDAATSATEAATSATNAANSATSASTSASTATTQATAAASSASAASTSATNAASSATSSANSATAAATSATNAATSESNASDSESAAATSETNAATSASSASTSASTATTKASEAATSATNAATSASNASTSETNAASSASSASTSATNAASSASSAATSASNASASADAALAALDNFDDRYLGQKTSDPTTDNDGDALVAGALYFNTTDDVMKVYEGSSWVAAYASLSGALLVSNNLSDLDNASAARTNLGLGTAATTAATDYVAVSGDYMTGNLSFGDDDRAQFGSGGDFQIYHDGASTNYIDAALGQTTRILSDTVYISNSANTADYLVANSTGVDISGTLTVNGIEITSGGGGTTTIGEEISLADNKKIYFGDGSDLQIYHDGNNSIIADYGTGNLALVGSDFRVLSNSGDKYISATDNAEVSLYYDSSTYPTAKLATTSTGIDVTGTVTADGLTVDGTLGSLSLDSSGARLSLTRAATNYIQASSSGGSLNFTTNGITDRLRIDSTGDISFYEDQGATPKLTWDASAEALDFEDNVKAVFGTGSDLQIYHNGSNAFAVNTDGDFIIRNLADEKDIYLQTDDGSGSYSTYLLADGSTGGLKLYHNSSSTYKLVTTSTGIDVVGDIDMAESGSDSYLRQDGDIVVGRDDVSNFVRLGSSNASDFLRFFSGGTEKMRIDSSGNVGINGTPSSYQDHRYLDLKGASATQGGVFQTYTSDSATLGYFYTNDGLVNLGSSTNDPLRFLVNGSEAMRIDTSGNVLVGTTLTNPATSNSTGLALRGSLGYFALSRDGDISATFNRKTSDGGIVEFRKDGTVVGSIGVRNNDNLYITGDSTQTGLQFGTNIIYPHQGSTEVDNVIDLGASNNRFKDLYLSGRLTNDGSGGLGVNTDGDVLFYEDTGATPRAIWDPVTERFGVGTTTPSDKIHISGGGLRIDNSYALITLQSGDTGESFILFRSSTDARGQIRYNNVSNYMRFDTYSGSAMTERMRLESDGDLHVDGDVIAYSTTISDERLKENIVGIEGALDKVSQLNGYTFNYKADGKVSAGVIAQEVEKVLPEAVSEKELPLKADDGEQYKVVNYDALHGLLIEAIKELKAEIAELKAAK